VSTSNWDKCSEVQELEQERDPNIMTGLATVCWLDESLQMHGWELPAVSRQSRNQFVTSETV